MTKLEVKGQEQKIHSDLVAGVMWNHIPVILHIITKSLIKKNTMTLLTSMQK